MRFISIGSGSKGNATIVEAGNTRLLVDCGFGLRDSLGRLEKIGIKLDEISAILVTHEHGDHSKGVAMLGKRGNIPVYLSHGSFHALLDRNIINEQVRVVFVDVNQSFQIGDIVVEPVAVPHDAREPCQFIFNYLSQKLGLLTDTGSITPHIIDKYYDCDALLMEFNHDEEMLINGPYPYSLQQRVGGNYGHLNNMQAIKFLEMMNLDRLKNVLVAHVSEKNNDLGLVKKLISSRFDAMNISLDNLHFASQDEGSDWLPVCG